MNVQSRDGSVNVVRFPLGQPRLHPVDVTMKKMWRNSEKALNEHYQALFKKFPYRSPALQQKLNNIYPSFEKAVPSLEKLQESHELPPLSFVCDHADDIGPRETMQDAHFFKEIETGLIAGVFDGHGGAGEHVARFINEEFPKRFEAKLKEVNQNYFQALDLLIHEIHREVAKNDYWHASGCTAVICAVDKKSHLIYTATLGDSEANLYRMIEDNLKSIPLSCVRNWSSKKDAKRAAVFLNDPGVEKDFPKMDPKTIYFPSEYSGINVSRAIGDRCRTGQSHRPGVIHKPKITVNQLMPGDRVILVCDGVTDYVDESSMLTQFRKSQSVAQDIVNFAINISASLDNVSVVVIDVK